MSLTNTKHLCDLPLKQCSCCIEQSNLDHLLFRQTRCWMIFAVLSVIAILPVSVCVAWPRRSFGNHIPHVVGPSAKPKVRWPHTRWIISNRTVMQHARSFVGNWTTMDDPTGSRSQDHSRTAFSDLSVSGCICSSCPEPTRYGDLDFGPKPREKVFIESLLRQVIRTIVGPLDKFHKMVSGHALGCLSSAEALSFYRKTATCQ